VPHFDTYLASERKLGRRRYRLVPAHERDLVWLLLTNTTETCTTENLLLLTEAYRTLHNALSCVKRKNERKCTPLKRVFVL